MSETDVSKTFDDFGFSFDMGLEEKEWPEEEEMFGEEGALSVDSGFFDLSASDGSTEFLPPDPDRIPVIENAMKQHTQDYQARPAEERTRELLGYMRPQRTVLLGIIDAARETVSNTAITEAIGRLRAHKFSVYDPSNLCTMLEQAGALERITADGEPYVRSDPQPEIVVIDGIEYYKPTLPPEIHWRATEAGLSALNDNDPEERLDRLFIAEAELLPIYKSVLEMVCAEGGAAMTALSGAIDTIEAIANPRRFFVQHFVENLERCESVEWNGSTWVATELGRRALAEKLDGVEAAETTPVNPDGTIANLARDGRLITETQGINW